MNAVEKLAVSVIRKAVNAPADAVLRDELRASRMARSQSAAVADLVFTYFRWRGFLDVNAEISSQLNAVRELDERFTTTPDSFTTSELGKAVPAWVADEVSVAREWLAALQTRPALWLRAKRGTGRELTRRIGNCKPASADLNDALRYTGDKDLFRTPEFHAGEFEVQDIASQIVGLLCDPEPGETWWDTCAGEGGKTLHLSDLMQNKGLIWASDRSERRLAKLRQRAARARAFNYRVTTWDGSEKLPTRTRFDGVLVDAPCSGIGTWQRNPHARWSVTKKDVLEMATIQRRLVLNAAAAVKPGGRLIYAVCTMARSETEAVADLCSQRLSGFAPLAWPAFASEPPAALGRKWILPQTYDGNGMFVAGWKRLP